MKCKKLSALVSVGYPDFPGSKLLELKDFYSEDPLFRYIDYIGKGMHQTIKRRAGLRVSVYQFGRKIKEYPIGEKIEYMPLSKQCATAMFAYMPSVKVDLNNPKEVLAYLHGTRKETHLVSLPASYVGEF